MSKNNRRSKPGAPRGAEKHRVSKSLSRRSLLRLGALAGAGASLKGLGPSMRAQAGVKKGGAFAIEEASIDQLRGLIDSRQLSCLGLTRYYLNRIETLDQSENGPRLRSILEVNPDAEEIAQQLDQELMQDGPRGPLHGIPIVIKDNIDTGDNMGTRAGSRAMDGSPALFDATTVERLRQAGAVILGKSGLSEWANFRGFRSSSGWSAIGGQVRNPYVLDRNPCGSSSGSAVAVSANLCAGSLGTETDGSIVCPAGSCGVVGLKPTVGLTSRAGVVPISTTFDSVGPLCRTVYDAAALLGPLTGIDPRDPATDASAGHFFADYTQFVDPDGLAGVRIGYDPSLSGGALHASQVFNLALAAMSDAGATIVPLSIPSLQETRNDVSQLVILIYEFKRALNDYLATRIGIPVASLEEILQFNLLDPEELLYFGQEWMELSQAEIFSEDDYLKALEKGPRLAGPEGIDAALALNECEAIVAPTNTPVWPIDLVNGDAFQFGSSFLAATAGYPLLSVPAGDYFGLPLGISFMAGAWSEPLLIKLASGFEAVTQARPLPTFQPTTPLEPPFRSRWRFRGGAQSDPSSLKKKAEELLQLGPTRPRLL